jgi:hypothetical protein
LTVDAVSIPKDKARCCLKWESFDHLLRCPQRRWMRRHIHMQNATTIMSENNEDIQDPERRCWHCEEIDSRNVPKMIAQKRSPALRWRLGPTNQVFGHCCLGNLKTELQQLTMDPRGTPTRIRSLHLADESPKRIICSRPTDAPTFPRPVPPKTFPMPTDHGVGVQRDQHLSPTFDIAGEGYPKEAIATRWVSSLRLPFQQRELLTKGKVLQREFMP